jgi:hypothetical protein
MAVKQKSPVWSGWIAFAALMLLVIGAVNVLEGIMALMYRQRTVVVQDRLYVIDLTGWGIVILAFGAVLVCAGIGLLSGRTWARVTAIVLVVVHAIIQVGWLAAYPLWSLLMLALDIVVLYALTAGWQDMTTTMTEFVPPPGHDRNDTPARQGNWDRTRTHA